jgi:transposase-like protein
MIITKEVKIKIVPKNFETYKNCGYDIKMGEQLILRVEDLPPNSRKIVKVECDNCGKEKEMKYNDYVKVFDKKQKYYCSDCRVESIRQGFQDKYGVNNCFQSDEIKSKIRKTIFEKYGVEHHLQNKDILQKLMDTNQERYGVNFIPELKKYTQEEFIDMCIKVHGDLYDYSLTVYKTIEDDIDIICPVHGKFSQKAIYHLRGHGCKHCSTDKLIKTKTDNIDSFIIKAMNIHGDLYDYSLVDYKNSKTKVEIICKKHGSFFQNPQDHINSKTGCPKCKTSKGENTILKYLEDNKIKYIHQKTFEGCIYKNKLSFDFYLPNFNVCIEYDGLQHFEVIEYFGGQDAYDLRILKDNIKTEYCRNNNIRLERIIYSDDILEKLERMKFIL